MKRLEEKLYLDTVWFGKEYSKEEIKKAINSDYIKEMINNNCLYGESWFYRSGRDEEFRKEGLSRMVIIQSQNIVLKIKQIDLIETEDKCGLNIIFETIGKVGKFLDGEMLKLNYKLVPRIIAKCKEGGYEAIRIITFDLIGGTADRA